MMAPAELDCPDLRVRTTRCGVAFGLPEAADDCCTPASIVLRAAMASASKLKQFGLEVSGARAVAKSGAVRERMHDTARILERDFFGRNMGRGKER